jgi:hypothetical protein
VFELEGTMDMPTCGHKLTTRITSNGGVGLFKGDVDIKTTYNDNEIEKHLLYNFIDSGKKVLIEIKTPFTGYEKYGVELAFENSMQRKTATAHVTWPTDEFGVKLDLGIESLTDFVIHVKVDVPVPGLAFKELHIENKVKEKSHNFALVGEWGSKTIGVKSNGYSTPYNGKLAMEAKLNDHVVQVKVDKHNELGDVEVSINGEKLPWFNGASFKFTTDLIRDRSTCVKSNLNFSICEKILLKVMVNGQQYIYIDHNPITRSAEIDLRRLISNNMQFNIAATYDLIADENGYKVLEIVNSYKNLDDPNGAFIKNNFFLRCQEESGSDKFCPKIEFSLKTLWPSRDVSETRGYLHHDHQLDNSNLRLNVEYIQNNVKMLRYEQTSEATYDVTGINTKTRSTF